VYGKMTAIGGAEKEVSIALFHLSPNLDPSKAWLSLQQERNRVFEPP